MESAPRSSKKWLSTDTCSVPTMSASTSAKRSLARRREWSGCQPEQRSGRRRRGRWRGCGSSGAGRCPASTPTAGPSRLRTRAQKRAMSIESAPRSSKKWSSTDTCSVPTMSASTSAKRRSQSAGAVAVVSADQRSGRRRRGRLQGCGSSGAGRRPASTPTAGPSRLRTRAQKRAISIESAPRSSKKWSSTDTCSVPTMPASTSAKRRLACSLGVRPVSAAASGRDVAGEGGREAPDRRVLVDVLHRHRRQVRRACAPARRNGPSASSRRRGRRRSCCQPTPARCPRCRPAPPRRAARIRREWSDRSAGSAVRTLGGFPIRWTP